MTIDTLIDKQDTFEIVRDQIAAILVTEIANQQVLATNAGKDPNLWKLRIFSERYRPWEQFLNTVTDSSPLINVWVDNMSYDKSTSDPVERQKSECTYNIDCYAYGLSSNNVSGGHNPGDKVSSFDLHRSIKLVRNILMASENTYLQLRGTVWSRWIDSINIFQPDIDAENVQNIIAGRIAFSVVFNEFSPQVTPATLDLLDVKINRKETGELYLEAQYT